MSYDDWLVEPYEYPSRGTAQESPDDFLDSDADEADDDEEVTIAAS